MSSGTTEESWWAGVIRPTMRKLILTWLVIAVTFWVFERNTRQQTAALKDDLISAKSAIATLDNRIQQGDTSVIAEMELMRQKVADFDSHFRLLSERFDEAKSNQAVQHAKIADLRRESSIAMSRLHALRKLVADWTAKVSGLMTGDSGRRIAGSKIHVTLIDGLLQRDRPTEVELTGWGESLNALTPPPGSAEDATTAIAITVEHEQRVQDLSRQLGNARDSLDQQLFLLDAILKETASQERSQQTLEQVIQETRLKREKESLIDLAHAREAARLAAQAVQTAELARLESEAVKEETMRQVEEIRAKQAQADQIAKVELERIAEETRLQEAKVRAQAEAIKVETEILDIEQKRKNLERDFERDLPIIQSLLSAFVSNGHSFRPDNAAGPVSLSFLNSQGALEPTVHGSNQLSYYANGGTRPPGALRNPSSQDLLRRAQDLLNKYGELMVEKKMLAP